MNKVILIGRLARDPELRTTASGVSFTRFTIAVNRFGASQNGQAQTDFIGCVAWRRQAETIAKYCSKGSQVAVDGRIQTGSYDGADGQKRYTTDVVADNVTFLGRANSSNENQNFNTEPAFGFPDTNNNNPFPTDNFSQSSNFNDLTPSDMPVTNVSDDPFKDFGEEVSLADDDLPF